MKKGLCKAEQCTKEFATCDTGEWCEHLIEHCQCDTCKGGATHASDCAVHNMPAEPNGRCDCDVFWNNMIFPCCNEPLPAPLEGVELATCSCGQSYLPKVLKEYHRMFQIVAGWREVLNGKALIQAEEGQGKYIADLVMEGVRIYENRETS